MGRVPVRIHSLWDSTPREVISGCLVGVAIVPEERNFGMFVSSSPANSRDPISLQVCTVLGISRFGNSSFCEKG